MEPVAPELFQVQIENLFLSFPVRTVKIGAICSKENLLVICNCLKQFPKTHVVLDPVLSSISGQSLFDCSALDLLKDELFPLTELITPNKCEFEILTKRNFNSLDEAVEIAKQKSIEWETAILLKGGHFMDDIIKEALVYENTVYCFEKFRKDFDYEHRTGCTLSTAISCFIGKGESLSDSCRLASVYLDKYYSYLQDEI